MQTVVYATFGQIIEAIQRLKNQPQKQQPRLIRSFRLRLDWYRRNQGRWIVALYNSGESVFYDQKESPAHTYYQNPWTWVPFKEFCFGGIVHQKHPELVNCKVPDSITFQHRGHNIHRVAQIVVNGFKFDIPEHCIQYVAIKYGKFRDSLLVLQPLPIGYLPRGPLVEGLKSAIKVTQI